MVSVGSSGEDCEVLFVGVVACPKATTAGRISCAIQIARKVADFVACERKTFLDVMIPQRKSLVSNGDGCATKIADARFCGAGARAVLL